MVRWSYKSPLSGEGDKVNAQESPAPKSRWKRAWVSLLAVTLVVLLGLAVAALERFVESPLAPSYAAISHGPRRDLASYLAASTRNVAFAVSDSNGHIALLFVDLPTGKVTKLSSKAANLLYPHLSPDGTRLLLVSHSTGRLGYRLISCETVTFVCQDIIKESESIVAPTELPNGRILYSSSPYTIDSKGRGRYAGHDFWLTDVSGHARKLTDLKFYELSSISVGGGKVYFSASGVIGKRKILPRQDPLAAERSNIFRMPFDFVAGSIDIPEDGVLFPLFAAGGLAMQPSVSPDGQIISFLRTKTNIGTYRYGVVVLNQRNQTMRRFETEGLSFSRPVVVGETVVANDILPDRYVIKRLSLDGVLMEPVATISDHTSLTEIEIK
jgi:hypothetical protein